MQALLYGKGRWGTCGCALIEVFCVGAVFRIYSFGRFALFLQLEGLKTEIASYKEKLVNLDCEFVKKRVNELADLKDSHKIEMAELENRLKVKHQEEITLLEQQYQVRG